MRCEKKIYLKNIVFEKGSTSEGEQPHQISKSKQSPAGSCKLVQPQLCSKNMGNTFGQVGLANLLKFQHENAPMFLFDISICPPILLSMGDGFPDVVTICRSGVSSGI